MKKTAIGIPASSLTLPVAGRDHLQGSIDAPILLVEYGDYECPYCGDAFPMVKDVQEQLGDKLCFAFRNFPLASYHPHAEHAAEAAESAGAQGHFWAMHDTLFENQDALEDDDLIKYAIALKLDSRRLAEEITTGVHRNRVREDFRSGARGGVNGTPTFFINGVHYTGVPRAEELLATIAALRSR